MQLYKSWRHARKVLVVVFNMVIYNCNVFFVLYILVGKISVLARDC